MSIPGDSIGISDVVREFQIKNRKSLAKFDRLFDSFKNLHLQIPQKPWTIEEEEQNQIDDKREVKYDVWFRGESGEAVTEEEVDLLWSSSSQDFEDSDTEPEIREYMEERESSRDPKANPTGEELWFDAEVGIVRNLHRESISLTSYKATEDLMVFGNRGDHFPFLSPEELKMLGVSGDYSKQNLGKNP